MLADASNEAVDLFSVLPTLSGSEGTADQDLLRTLSRTNPFAIRLLLVTVRGARRLCARFLACDEPIHLHEILQLLNSFALLVDDIRPSRIDLDPVRPIFAYDLLLAVKDEVLMEDERRRIDLGVALDAALRGDDEADLFSRLVHTVGLSRTETRMLRTFARYLVQIGFARDIHGISDALERNAEVATLLVRYFMARFDPSQHASRDSEMAAVSARLEAGMRAVDRREDERVLSKLVEVMRATQRTNYFQKEADGRSRPYLSLKFRSAEISGLPLPRPMFEIFVSGSRVEGVHLRGGKVARGGIRWSDRPQDLRTEVHGLMKAQMVKNVVIVPQGSKGGFVVRRPPGRGDKCALRNEAMVCYQQYIRGLLDLTDNIVAERIAPPADVVRHDEDDPYLVVAADKGTATFSDAANEVALQFGYWLGDAFASGGSAGYDHKAMGITARGAWESVKRHFREMGLDTTRQTFTVVGVGDMSGDVFGNGMLLSDNIRLIAAFDHRHIFLDPDPDPARSWLERKRLFELAGSSWLEYDPTVLSAGGAVLDRSARTVTISDRMCEVLGLENWITTPDVLVRAILRAQVDLLWMGGVGTFVKAAGETQDAAGDQSNDTVRVDACELRCRVVGEGANLGLTQAARVEYALAGGRINTDAIDNAGGVSCSDHEVNIKILLSRIEARGELTRSDRDLLLRGMTEDVAALVLRDNYLQSQALSIAASRAPQNLHSHVRLIRRFEREGQLDRTVAGLPDDGELQRRHERGLGLCRPELAVLLAHTKISLFAELISSDFPDDRLFEQDLVAYFPEAMQVRFRRDMLAHPLRREIITTAVVNSMTNRSGSGFVNDIQERTGASDADVARAFAVARDVLGAAPLWSTVEALDGLIPAGVQTDILHVGRDAIETATLWLVRHIPWPIAISKAVDRFAPVLASYRDILARMPSGEISESLEFRASEYMGRGVPESVAYAAATLPLLPLAFDVALVSEEAGVSIAQAFDVSRDVEHGIERVKLINAVRRLPRTDEWANRMVVELEEDIADSVRKIAVQVLRDGECSGPREWFGKREKRLHRLASLIGQLSEQKTPALAIAVLCIRELRCLGSAT